MTNLLNILSERTLSDLRHSYDSSVMRNGMLTTISATYPPISAWNAEIESTFYGTSSPIAPADRERCLLAMLAITGPQVSFGIHVYWGLMEGLSVAEICHVAGLAACYGGVPRLGHSLPTIGRVLDLLNRRGPTELDAGSILASLVSALGQ